MGYDYWLASETSHLNESQILILIKLGIKNVTIAFDNDVKYTDILKMCRSCGGIQMFLP